MEVITVAKVDNVGLTQLSHSSSPQACRDSNAQPSETGSLLITPHHLIWSPSLHSHSRTIPSNQQGALLDGSNPSTLESSGGIKMTGEVCIANRLLTAVQHLPRLLRPTLLICLATFVFYTISFSSPSELDGVWDSLKALVYNRKPGEKESLYAFIKAAAFPTSGSPPKPPSLLPGWDLYDPHAEFARMGVIRDPSHGCESWHTCTCALDRKPYTRQNNNTMNDTTLTYAVKYRSKGRLPVGTYVHWSNGSSITRSSQPKVGFKNARSIQDEKLIEAIFHLHALHTGPVGIDDQPNQQVVYGATSSNLIIDAQPTTNAMANTVKAAGTENMEYYKGCRKAYLRTDNIHVMRDSLNRVVSALHESFITETPVSLDTLKRSGWLKHIGAVLEGTSMITRTVHVYNSHVLIHCSDGWDRTSQLSALSQVCLDPYYKTLKGFTVLVEKDWLSFGHKFSDRSGIVIPGRERMGIGDSPNHSNYAANLMREESKESSSGGGSWVTSIQKQLNFGNSVGSSHAYKETLPVFHQFLDCVYQLQRQYPRRFEFNSCYLERLHEELHAQNYGTFLFNCEKERKEPKGAQVTCSVWELFLPPNDLSKYRNTEYDASLDNPTKRSNTDQGVLYPDVKDITFWWELFGCPDEQVNPARAVVDSNPGSEFTHIETLPFQREEIWSQAENIDKLTLGPSGNPNTRQPRAGVKSGSPRTLPADLNSMSSGRSKGGDFQPSGQSDTQYTSSANQAGDPLQAAFQQAKIMGWSTWDRLKKGYEEVSRGNSIPSHSSFPGVHQLHHQLLSEGGSRAQQRHAQSAVDVLLSPRHQQHKCLPSSLPNPWSDPNPRPLSSSYFSPAQASNLQNEIYGGPLVNDPWLSSKEGEIFNLETQSTQWRPHSPATTNDQGNTLLGTNPAKSNIDDQSPAALFQASSLASHPSVEGKPYCRAEQGDIDPLGVGFT